MTGTSTAGFGKVASVGPLRVRPIALVEDSRCPINARCIWAGRLILKAQVELRGGGEQLTTNLTLGSPYIVGADQLTLVSAEPAREARAKGNPPANRFTFDYAAMR
jgi:hypothetical protein